MDFHLQLGAGLTFPRGKKVMPDSDACDNSVMPGTDAQCPLPAAARGHPPVASAC